MKPTKASYSFEVKKEVVSRYLAGEKAMDLAAEFGLSSVALIRSWALGWKKYGDEAFEPQRKGRPPGASTNAPLSAEDLLRRENRRLLAENAYLKKLRDLREQGHH
ncbi:helix-turn-helix domain-containing protein [Neomicrococcus lactis]|uniref:helix-turn-helix domain-containing protein n=1 Tax=Neomicrococcus lactis TaxID=732241 RepID=UPI0023007631|nr:helix-turn-helix domain-containing protein [Neomicrococcus lactis]